MMLGLSDGEDHVILRPVHTGNKYCCRKRQQIGNKVSVSGNNLLPKNENGNKVASVDRPLAAFA